MTASAHLRSICRLVPLVWRAAPGFFSLILGINLITGILPVGRIFVNAAMLALLADLVHGGTASGVLFHRLEWLLLLLAAFNIMGALLGQIDDTVDSLFQIRVSNYMQGIILEKAAMLDLEFFENPEFHNKLQNASSEAGTRPLAVVQQLLTVASSVATMVSMGVIVACWHPWLIPIIFIPPAVLFWMNSNLAAAAVEMKLRRTETARKAGYLSSMLSAPMPAKEIRLFGLSGFFLTNLRRLWDELYDEKWAHSKRKLALRSAFSGIMSLNQPLIVGYAAWQLIGHSITFRKFSLYTQAVFSLQSRLNGLAGAVGRLHEHNLFAAAVLEFLELMPKVEAPRVRTSQRPISRLPKIEFRNVTFRYPGTESQILRDVSFKIEPGEKIALVGENGAGKSTIVKLLGGLYEPDRGGIYLDDVNIRELGRAELRGQLSVILQDFVIYNLSARENIGVGNLDSMDREGDIERAARASGFHAVAEKLPDGYETVLARSFKRGHELSGGQRQLVALSRALLRSAPILVLDEPTAALDVSHERHFIGMLLRKQMTAPRSVLLVCHRLTAVRHAQKIIVLGGGCVVEQGSHEQLMASRGPYHDLFKLQLDMYGDSWLTDTPEASSEMPDSKVR